jgi:DNA-directed RNA polymerase specialized sigma24 family protein
MRPVKPVKPDPVIKRAIDRDGAKIRRVVGGLATNYGISQDAEDALHRAFVDALVKGSGHFKDEDEFTKWIIHASKMNLIDTLRRRRATLGDLDELIIDRSSSRPDGEEAEDVLADCLRKLAASIAELPLADRVCLFDRHERGLRLENMVPVHGRNITAVHRNLKSIHHKLMSILIDRGAPFVGIDDKTLGILWPFLDLRSDGEGRGR